MLLPVHPTPFLHLLLKILFQLGHRPVVKVLVLHDGPQSLVRPRKVHLLQRHDLRASNGELKTGKPARTGAGGPVVTAATPEGGDNVLKNSAND